MVTVIIKGSGISDLKFQDRPCLHSRFANALGKRQRIHLFFLGFLSLGMVASLGEGITLNQTSCATLKIGLVSQHVIKCYYGLSRGKFNYYT